MGDSALVIEFAGSNGSPSQQVRAACSWLAAADLPGIREWVPAATTVGVFYSPLDLVAAGWPIDGLEAHVTEVLQDLLMSMPLADEAEPGRLVEIPICYEREFAPDLEEVAARLKLSTAEVVAHHSTAEYRVTQLGFAPGFPYLGGLAEALRLPRRDIPRTAVPAGSVGIANDQSCLYPVSTPGGWNLIGRTPVKLFRPELEPPVLLEPGDRVKFHAISAAEFHQREGIR